MSETFMGHKRTAAFDHLAKKQQFIPNIDLLKRELPDRHYFKNLGRPIVQGSGLLLKTLKSILPTTNAAKKEEVRRLRETVESLQRSIHELKQSQSVIESSTKKKKDSDEGDKVVAKPDLDFGIDIEGGPKRDAGQKAVISDRNVSEQKENDDELKLTDL
ncbi:hypothetical protein PCE1_001586 [Barthelona sp. PCE]